MEKPIIIEFAGVSCCGKSTAFSTIFKQPIPTDVSSAEHVLKTYYVSLTKKIFFVDITTPAPIYKAIVLTWIHLSNVARYPKFYRLCITAIMQQNQKLKAFNSFFFKVGKSLLLRKINKGVTLVDEGIIQLLFSLFVQPSAHINKPDHELNKIMELNKFIEHAPLPDEVIFGPIAPQQQIVDRMINRGHHRVTTGFYTSKDLTARVNDFTEQSINLQLKITKQLNGRLIINTLSDTDQWGKIINRFRDQNGDIQPNHPTCGALMYE